MNLDGVKYINGTASAQISSAPGIFYGVVVNSHTYGRSEYLRFS